MPSYVNPEKCDGCKALDRTACQYICPNDLMVLDKNKMKAYNRDAAMCWECYNCVKICPTQAIEVRGYAELATSIGHPGAARAVGRANGLNRIAILIPCHRVVNADGTLCGYGGGLWRKARLLGIERGNHAPALPFKA